jgi:hypothetical protein
MAGRLRAPLAGVVLAAAAVVPGWGCADMFQQQQPGASASAAPGPRTAPDDSDLWNLVQASADVVAEADMAALRASPWSSSIMQTNHQAQLAGQLLFGYDIFTESDRLMQVTFDAAGAQRNLTILRGTFDPARVHAAFVAATPGATEGRWRESPIWEGNGRAVALVTPRTLVQGDPGDVRGAIDAAWGVVPDARAVPLGAARRSLDADHPGPAAFIAFNVTEGMQGRAASMGLGQVPPGLALGAARLDLGDDLNAEVLGIFDTPANAVAAAAGGTVAVRTYAQNVMVRMLGLGPVLNGVVLGTEGTRLHGHLRIPADRREGLGDKVAQIVKMIAAAHP